MSNEKVLVTGGNGFLALHIIQHLLIIQKLYLNMQKSILNINGYLNHIQDSKQL